MSKSFELPPNSETTGPMSLGSAVANCLGQARGGTIAERHQSASNALAQLRPFDTDRRVADALQHISGRRPTFRRRTMFPENGPTYQVTEGVSWTCSEAQQQEAITAVEFSMRSAPEALIAKALYELRVVTRGRVNREQSDDEAEAIIFTERLRQFPADIVLDTLKNWPARSDGQWWPTWHDLHKIIEPQATARRLLADHIRSGACLALGKPAAQEPERDDSPEGVAARQAFVERQKRKLNYPAAEPVSHAEDFASWEKREKERLSSEGLPKLSSLFVEETKRKLLEASHGKAEFEAKQASAPTPTIQRNEEKAA